MDWRNKLHNIQNKIKGQLWAKKIDDLEMLYQQMKSFDQDNSGSLDKDEFQKFLASLGLFLTTQELRTIYDEYDLNKDGNINYKEFVNMIRVEMTQKRIDVVKHAFEFVDKQQFGKISLDQLSKMYRADQHPRVRTRQKSQKKVKEEFLNAIAKKSSDGKSINFEEFLDYYYDVNATLPTDKEEYFIDLLIRTWAITAHESYVSPERLADLEIIIFEKIRQKTLTKDDEGKCLKQSFQYFDLENKGVINIQQFTDTLKRYGCVFSHYEIAALYKKYDKDNSGRLCYDEFCGMISTIGSGVNVNPVFTLKRQPPTHILNKIKQVFLKRSNNELKLFAKIFANMDKNKSGTLDRDEFNWGLAECGIKLSANEFENIFKYFDKNCDNCVNYNEFITLLRGQLNETRRNIVLQAFAKLDKTQDGVVTIEDLKGVYDPTYHRDVVINQLLFVLPKYKSGKKSGDQILKEFLNQWDTCDQDGKVTVDEFCKYYEEVGAGIDDDIYFVDLVKRAWKLY